MPVLHHLPDKEPNISMGYPLDRTSLARLIENILVLQENRLEDGRYAWRDVINLIRHPYLRLLGPEEKPLRKNFPHMGNGYPHWRTLHSSHPLAATIWR